MSARFIVMIGILSVGGATWYAGSRGIWIWILCATPCSIAIGYLPIRRPVLCAFAFCCLSVAIPLVMHAIELSGTQQWRDDIRDTVEILLLLSLIMAQFAWVGGWPRRRPE